ncbi:MAG: hypothetical protein QOF02_2199 [Blastocatellia bacterium]|jgi:hypothetical protein|nr:hypothetical protein [Blastocatellia bacterium]
MPGDYDGDRRADLAVFRPADGNWHIRKSTGGTLQQNWGLSEDKPVQGDFDGDGKTGIAVWRPSQSAWHVIQSSSNSGWQQFLGQSADTPIPAAYLPQESFALR